jgi:hypothetical protein
MLIDFSLEEANALIRLLDSAVKADGLKSANDALILAAKIQQALQSLQTNTLGASEKSQEKKTKEQEENKVENIE